VNSAWAVVVAALGSSFLTIIGAFGVEWWRKRLGKRESIEQSVRDACVALITAALSLAFRSAALHETMIIRSGLSEAVDVTLHLRRPVDTLEISNWLHTDYAAMTGAQMVIWIHGDKPLISQASTVMAVAQRVVSTSTALSEAQQAHNRSPAGRFRQLPRDPETEAARDEATRELGRECREFARLMRVRSGTHDIDALLRMFPGDSAKADDRSADGTP
jgi:hypothetical protein